MQRKEGLFIAGALDDGNPMAGQSLVIEIPEVQEELQIDVHNARDVFRALEVAAHPIERIGDAGKHQRELLIPIQDPGIFASSTLR